MNISHNLQVESSHYFNSGYNHKARWLTYFYQIDRMKSLGLKRVLEIGPGHGWMKRIAEDLDIHIETADIDPDLRPDHVASVNALPFADNAYDAVCAFEVLEHLPFETFVQNLREMARVAEGHVIISLPDHRRTLFHIRLKIPFLPYWELLLKIPTYAEHVFDGQHYWEIGKKGYSVETIKAAIASSGLVIEESLVYPDTPMNHFFVMKKPKH